MSATARFPIFYSQRASQRTLLSSMPAAKKPTATKKPAASKASDQLALLAKVPSQALASPLRSTPPARTRQRTTQRAHLRLSSSSQRAAMSVGCLEQPSWHTAASVRRTLVSGSTRSRPTSARCTRRSRSPPQETRRRSSRPPPTRSSKRCARPFASATGARAAPPNFPLVCGARSPQPHACHAALQGHDRHQGHA